jgi:signal transduction histidine kinase
VEAHQGRIWVESESGSGACFVFILPIAIPETEVDHVE